MINLPEDFLKRMKSDLGGDYGEFLESFNRPAEKGVRVNTLKISPERFSKLAPVGLDGKVGWEESGFYARGEGLGKNLYHAAGLYYVQEPSAMCAAPQLEIKRGERVLDLCAAPGGKSTQIAQYLENEGLFVANEIDLGRSKILKSNLERFGVQNAAVTCSNPESLAQRFANFFDKILVDAPCSGEGMFKKEPAAVREWSLKSVQACAVRQAKILESAHKMLAGGGRLVYSTCTFAPEEDERQIDNFLKLHPEYKLVAMNKLLPHKIRGEGHFYAALIKADGERAEDFGIKPDKNPCVEFEAFKTEILNKAFKNIVKTGDNVYSLVDGAPADIRAGIKLGEVKNGRFEPAHALAMSLKSDDVKVVEVDTETAVRYLRGLTFDCADTERGWRVVFYNGFPLGWCKVVGGVAKNHLPKGLRI